MPRAGCWGADEGGPGAGRAVPGAGLRTRVGRVPPQPRPPGAARRGERSRARRGAPRGTPRMGREPRRQRPCRWGEAGGGRVTGAGGPGDTRCNREVLYSRGGPCK